jgi:GT2 family glycosyltransferase
MNKVAIVILNWNGKHYLQQFLGEVVKHSAGEDIAIYVADNGSTDGSVEYLKAEFTSVKRILLDRNYGFSEGYNLALRQVEATYYVLLNSDVEVTPGWLDPIIELMDRQEKIAACQPKILSYQYRDYFEYAGAGGGYIDRLGYPFCRGRILDNIEKDQGQYDQVADIFWASGACMFVRSELYHAIGGFDPLYFAHMEEIDLCWRLKGMGYRIIFQPHSVVYHVGGGTLPNEHPWKLYLNFRNNLLTLYKNLPPNKLVPVLLARQFFDLAAAVQYFLRLKPAEAWAVTRAYLSFLKKLPGYCMLRKKVQAAQKVTTYREWYKKSLLFDFYFRGIRKFTELDMRAFRQQ